MKKLKLKAFAKINLTLDITGKREDGYHTLETVMQSISLCDDIEIELVENPSVDEKIVVTTNLSYIPTNKKNTVYKAAELYMGKSGMTGGVKIDVKKRIPSRAGMGGGSSDAAAVLRALNKMNKNAISERELLKLGEQIGADVPFCMLGGTYKCSGIGEIMESVSAMPDCFLVICKPPVGMSTPRAYAIIDEYPPETRFATPKLIKALESRSIEQVASSLANRFDEILRMRKVREIKEKMQQAGALGKMMTGSGSAVYGIFTDEQKAKKCANSLRAEKLGDVFEAKPVNSGVEEI